MSEQSRLHRLPSALATARASRRTGGSRRVVLLRVHPARAEQLSSSRWFVVYLLLLVRAWSAGTRSYAAIPRLVRDARRAGAERRQLPVPRAFHAITLFNAGAAGDGGAHRRTSACPASLIAAAHYAAWAAASAFVAWLAAGADMSQATDPNRCCGCSSAPAACCRRC